MLHRLHFFAKAADSRCDAGIPAGASRHRLKHRSAVLLIAGKAIVQQSVNFIIESILDAILKTKRLRVAQVVRPNLRAGLAEAESADTFDKAVEWSD